ncbi:MAG TPA: STAS/SEC14 domain-containing protein [Kofleriaceae bacterium]|nr:STAS/SEC14 domain-containing protein [Kofleriaceae bacterium]
MMERIEGLPEGVDGVRALGKLRRRDYRRVLKPILDDARRAKRKIRLLYQLGPQFEGFSVGAAIEDALLTVRYRQQIERCAIVTEVRWIAVLSRWAAVLTPFALRVFSNRERALAAKWLSSEGAEEPISHRLLTERGVLVIEPTQPLRKSDFDVLARTVDPWIEREGRLHGLVIHTRDFPGWEDLGSLARHVQFVRDHQALIDRMAISGDMTMFSKRIARRLMGPNVEQFAFEELDDAVSWAAAQPSATELRSRSA